MANFSAIYAGNKCLGVLFTSYEVMTLYCECISTYCVTYMKSVCQNG